MPGKSKKRFLNSYKEVDGCFIWTGSFVTARGTQRYPTFNFSHGGKQHVVTPGHLMYDIKYGGIFNSEEVPYLLNDCDNGSSCINPDHKTLTWRKAKSSSMKQLDAKLKKDKKAAHISLNESEILELAESMLKEY